MTNNDTSVKFPLKLGLIDIVPITITLIIGILLSIFIFFLPADEGLSVSIYYGGSLIASEPLDGDDPRYIILFKGEKTEEYDLIYPNNQKFSNCTMLIDDLIVEINDGGVSIIEETSPNNICSNMGTITRPGIPLTCAPNYVMVLIETKYAQDVIIPIT